MTDPLPDVEAILTTVLRANGGVAALVADRVYSDLPHKRTYPLVVVTRVGGAFVINRPLYLEAAEVILDCYGGTHRDAQQLMATCLTGLRADLIARHTDGAVTRLTIHNTIYNPDTDSVDSEGHGRPRFSAELTVHIHP